MSMRDTAARRPLAVPALLGWIALTATVVAAPRLICRKPVSPAADPVDEVPGATADYWPFVPVRRELPKLVPDLEWRHIPMDHPLFRIVYPLSNGFHGYKVPPGAACNP